MGFGFNLFFALILMPLTVILLITWLFSHKMIFGKILGFIWLGIVLLAILSQIAQKLNAKIELKKEDFYGKYIIDRTFFPGKQSDWQYNNFRFEIKDNDKIYFKLTNGQKIINTLKGKISTVNPYGSARLVINMNEQTNHILKSNPTIYRVKNGFYLVFNSPKFGNVFFRKGKWKNNNGK